MYICDLEIEKIDGKTVYFKNGTKRKCTKKELESIVSEEPRDLTQLRDGVLDKVVPELLNVLMEYNIKKGDIQPVLNTLVATYNENFNIAVGKAFGTYEEGKHSAYFPENIRLSDIKKFI